MGHYESLETSSTEVMGKGESGLMRKSREKKETTTGASSLSAVDLEKSECKVAKMGQWTSGQYRLILRFNFLRGLTVNQSFEEMLPILGEYCSSRPKLES